MSKGKRIRNARERPEKKIPHGLTTDNYRILKWTSMLTLGTMFYDLTGMSDTAQHILESAGDISVPLYSFLEVKAFHHTESKWKHFLKIFLLGLAGVIPFSVNGIIAGLGAIVSALTESETAEYKISEKGIKE